MSDWPQIIYEKIICFSPQLNNQNFYLNINQHFFESNLILYQIPI
jgi:hypothetical protein